MTTESVSKSLAAIATVVDAGRPLIYVQSAEEDRVIGLLAQIAEHCPGGRADLFLWSITEGLRQNGRPCRGQPDGPRGILDFIIAADRPGIFLLKDFHEFLRDAAEIRRRLRDLYYECLNTGKFAVICSPARCIPEEISREVAFIELPRPDRKELEELLRAEAKAIVGAAGELPEETVFTLTRALQGFTFNEARHALRRAVSAHGRLDPTVVPTIEEEKRLLVRKT
ncbi:MAG: AAA family ATPase, partial [Phycisphaerae bacterium]